MCKHQFCDANMLAWHCWVLTVAMSFLYISYDNVRGLLTCEEEMRLLNMTMMTTITVHSQCTAPEPVVQQLTSSTKHTAPEPKNSQFGVKYFTLKRCGSEHLPSCSTCWATAICHQIVHTLVQATQRDVEGLIFLITFLTHFSPLVL